jgi:tRNA(fMet)-specific endonuclease VapC
MAYLLDTNIVSDLVRHPRIGRVRERIRQVGEGAVCTSIIVAAEARYGIRKGGSAKLARQVETVLKGLDIIPFEAPADAIYARLRAELERAGRPLGGNDLLIAAHALALGHTLVTADGGFAHIAELPRENWLTQS